MTAKNQKKDQVARFSGLTTRDLKAIFNAYHDIEDGYMSKAAFIAAAKVVMNELQNSKKKERVA